jgi:riboflavin transporter FmnP
MADRISGTSPRLKARFAGIFYAVTIVTGAYGLFTGHTNPWGHVANLVAGAAYLAVTALLYDLLRPVNKNLSLLAAFFSLVGVASGDDGFFFFGFYCLLIGFLIYRSSFFPRVIGGLMGLSGLALLTNAVTTLVSPELARSLSHITTGFDGLGEMSLTLWLLVFGVNIPRWYERANASGTSQTAPHVAAR